MSASFAATERPAQNTSGPRITATVVEAPSPVKAAVTGFFGKIKAFFGLVVEKIKQGLRKVYGFVRPAVEKVVSFVPAQVRRFIPSLAFLPMAFAATWRFVAKSLTWLWTKVLNKPWMWMMTTQVKLAAYAMTHKGTFKGMLANLGTFVLSWLPWVVGIAIPALLAFRVIGITTALVGMLALSPVQSTLVIAGCDLRPDLMAWAGRAAVVVNIAAALLGWPALLVAQLSALGLVAAATFLGVYAARKAEADGEEYSAAIYSPEQTADVLAKAEETLSEAMIVAEAKEQDEAKAEAEEQGAEVTDEEIALINVVPSKLSKGYDRVKVVATPEGHDVNLKAMKDVRWHHGIAYSGDRPVACDLRPGLKPSQRDGRRKAFARAFVEYLKRQNA